MYWGYDLGRVLYPLPINRMSKGYNEAEVQYINITVLIIVWSNLGDILNLAKGVYSVH